MKNRTHWIYALLALTGGIIGGALSGQFVARDAEASARAARVLKAEKFVLVARDGTERGVIEVNSRGVASVALNDQKGRRRGEFRVGADSGGAVGFFGQDGNRRVIVGETPNGRDGVAIYAANGRQMAGFTVAKDNQSSVTLYDPASGRARVGLGVASSGIPALVLFDEKGRDRAELHVNADGKAGLALADESGKSIAGLPMQEAPQVQQ